MSARKKIDRSDVEFWRLYRKERKKFGSFRTRITDAQITRAAREARRKLESPGDA